MPETTTSRRRPPSRRASDRGGWLDKKTFGIERKWLLAGVAAVLAYNYWKNAQGASTAASGASDGTLGGLGGFSDGTSNGTTTGGGAATPAPPSSTQKPHATFGPGGRVWDPVKREWVHLVKGKWVHDPLPVSHPPTAHPFPSPQGFRRGVR
jgi:hypothetical protein